MSRLKSLVIILTEPLTMFLSPTEVSDSILLSGKPFVDSGFGDWVGFYDWLRTPSGELVGVRTWMSGPEIEAVRQELARNAAVELGENDVRVWWSKNRSFDEAASGDQDLGTHRIMRFGEDEFALTFNIERLSENELQTLSGQASLM